MYNRLYMREALLDMTIAEEIALPRSAAGRMATAGNGREEEGKKKKRKQGGLKTMPFVLGEL